MFVKSAINRFLVFQSFIKHEIKKKYSVMVVRRRKLSVQKT